MRQLIAIALAVALAGCSFFMKTNPKGWEPSQKPTCSDRSEAPAADTLAAGVGVIMTLVAVGCGVAEGSASTDNPGPMICLLSFGAIGLPTMAVYGTSAVTGWRRAGRCREAKRQREAWLALPPEEKARKLEEKRVRKLEEKRVRKLEEARARKREEAMSPEERMERARCARLISAWRRARIRFERFRLWDRMPEVCRELAKPRAKP